MSEIPANTSCTSRRTISSAATWGAQSNYGFLDGHAQDTLTLVGLKGPPAGRKLNGRGTMDVTLSP